MSRIRWYGPALALVATVLVVMVVGPGLTRQLAYTHKAAEIKFVRNSLAENTTLAQMNDAFRRVAEVVEPSVVSVEVAQRVQSTRRGGAPDWLRQRMPPGFDPPESREREQDSDDGSGYEQFDVPQFNGQGSGWVYDVEGHIVTNYHVVNAADEITVRFIDGAERKATVLQADPKTDIAVLKVEGGDLHPATLAAEPVLQGDIVFAFGSPFRFRFSMSQGIVSAKERELGILQGRGGYESFIQTDAAINPGNSGGPLTNIRGEIVGMNTAIASRTGANNGLGFAIPVDMVSGIVDQLIANGKVVRGFLGVEITELDPQLAKTFDGLDGGGVLVVRPMPDGPADKVLQSEDVITHIQGQRVTRMRDLRDRIASLPPGEEVDIKVFRQGETVDAIVTLGELPEADEIATRRTTEREPSDLGAELLKQLGLEMVADYTAQRAEEVHIETKGGVLVGRVRPNSAAAAAGLGNRPAVITHVQGKPVQDVKALVDTLRKLQKSELTDVVRIRTMSARGPSIAVLELPEL